MRTHTTAFKNAIKQFGRELDTKITYTLNNSEIVLDGESLNSVSYHYEGAILKSVMKQLNIDSNIDIPLNTLINLEFGVKVSGTYEYLNYGNFVVYSSEKKEDTGSYGITCYDKLLYSMVDYETPKVNSTAITYPITVRNYLSAICSHLGLTFANSSDTFANYDKLIPSELYIDNEGNSLGYTFRDVLDELAEVVAGTLCINNDDELEIRYIPTTENNLIDLGQESTTAYGITITVNGTNAHIEGVSQGAYHVGLTNENIEREIEPGNYTFSINAPITKGNIVISFYRSNGDFISYARISTNTSSVDFTLPEKAFYYKVAINLSMGGTRYNEDLTFTLSGVDTINEEYLKDINVNFGEQYGPINTIILSRSGGADKISQSSPSDLANDLKNAIVIEDNQIMNDDNRSDFIPDILSQLYGLQYYINDFSSPGIAYLELCDRYNVSIGENIYPCVMLNDEINVAQGLEENIYTDLPDTAKEDYSYMSQSDKSDLLAKRATIIANKVNGIIELMVSALGDSSGNITPASIMLAIDNDQSSVTLSADKININGVVSANNGFSIDLNGKMTATGADIVGGAINLNDNDGTSDVLKIQSTNTWAFYRSNHIGLVDRNTGASFSLFLNDGYDGYMSLNGRSGDYDAYITLNANGRSSFGKGLDVYGTLKATNIKHGYISSINDTNWKSVQFSQTMPNIPHVTVTVVSGGGGVVALKIRNISTSGFEVIIGGSYSGTVDACYIAISD